MIERYRSKGFPCCGGIGIGGWRRYSSISSKAFWHSLFHVCGSSFHRSLKIGSQVEVSLAMNRLMSSFANKLGLSFQQVSQKQKNIEDARDLVRNMLRLHNMEDPYTT